MITITCNKIIYKIMILNTCNKGMVYDKFGEIIFTYDYELKNISFENTAGTCIELNSLYINSVDFIGTNPDSLKINNCRIFKLKEKIRRENYCKLIEIQTVNGANIKIKSFSSDPAFIFGQKIIYYGVSLKYDIKYIAGYWIYKKN